jgi:uncharacterized protein (TIGR02186 family)
MTGRSIARLLMAGCLAAALAVPAVALAQTTPPAKRETIEADVSISTIMVDAGFAGTQVVIFGTVENSRQTSPDERLYDVAVVLVGPRQQLAVRQKAQRGGIWVNAKTRTFKDVASFYTIVTSRPVAEIAPKPVLWQYGIGFDNMRFASDEEIPPKELDEFRQAILRLKGEQKLYREEPRGLSFIGRSLFRAAVDLPANVTIGEFSASIYLFRKGELLSSYKTQLGLQREAVEQTIYSFAYKQPLPYGLVSVVIALLAGLAATFIFRRD